MYQEIDGRKFYKCANGYYSDGTGMRMHRYVWERYNGAIPKGFHIHHIDKNKDNNDISNLELVEGRKHLSIHMEGRDKGKIRELLNRFARPKAAEWHGSESGREWHKKHWEESKAAMFAERVYECSFCGREYTTTKAAAGNTFCSNACKSAYRRKSGVDNEERICEVCGAKYVTNKYVKRRTCSRTCGNKLGWEERRGKGSEN